MSVRAGRCLVVALSVSLSASLSVSLSVQAARPSVARVEAVDTWGPVHRFEGAATWRVRGRRPGRLGHGRLGTQRGWPEPARKVARCTPTAGRSPPATLGSGFAPRGRGDPWGTSPSPGAGSERVHDGRLGSPQASAGRPWTRPVHVSRDRNKPGYPGRLDQLRSGRSRRGG